MPYRRSGEALEIETAEGVLRAWLGGDAIELRVADRAVRFTRQHVIVETRADTHLLPVGGRVVVARNVPRDDLSLWMQLADGDTTTMRRLIGVPPLSVFDEHHLTCVRQLEDLERQLQTALRPIAGEIVRGTELGAGSDAQKLLLVELRDRHAVFARRLFRGDAQLVVTVHADGRIAFLHAPRELRANDTATVSVRGQHVHFTSWHAAELARIALPWVAPEDGDELARRLGQLLTRARRTPPAVGADVSSPRE